MKKILIIVFLIILVLFTSINLYAMPPHPNNLEKLTNKTDVQKFLTKLNHQKKIGIDNSIKSFKSISDQAKILVILVEFKDLKFNEATSANNFILPIFKRKFNIPFDAIPFMLFGLTILMSFFLLNKKIKRKIIIISFTLILVLSLNACLNPAQIDYFDNSKIKFYKNLFEYTEFSWKQYYLDMSNGLLNLSFDIIGPFSADKEYTYYGQNDPVHSQDMHPAELVGLAIDKAENAGVDFSKYDNDDDGKVDAVVVIHAGPAEEIGHEDNYIWSHRWSLALAAHYSDGNGARHYDGVTIDDYTIQPEFNIQPGDSTIGVFCHEFGHVLGLPDLYDYQYEANGVGMFSLMDAGSYCGEDYNGSRPAPLTAWERSILGWLDYKTVNEGETISNFVIFKSLGTNRNALKVQLKKDTDTDQFLFLEYLYKETGTWTEFIPGSGLLVLRIDQKLVDEGVNGPNSYNFNDFKDLHHGVEVVEADNQWELWDASIQGPEIFGEQEDLFTEVADAVLSPSTSPNTNYYPGEGNYGHTPTLNSGVIIDIKAITAGTSIIVSVRQP